ncbi:MAG: hypothetical protein Q7U64_08230 [Desulfocapsaceae bacterium]|nr:hypothetical protein [Desulfocapsaceae bacterium]
MDIFSFSGIENTARNYHQQRFIFIKYGMGKQPPMSSDYLPGKRQALNNADVIHLHHLPSPKGEEKSPLSFWEGGGEGEIVPSKALVHIYSIRDCGFHGH